MCCCDFSCFFCKQKTAYEMRISNVSSDVCSSYRAIVDRATTNEDAGVLMWKILGERRHRHCHQAANGQQLQHDSGLRVHDSLLGKVRSHLQASCMQCTDVAGPALNRH